MSYEVVERIKTRIRSTILHKRPVVVVEEDEE
jgi:hypothetical protein